MGRFSFVTSMWINQGRPRQIQMYHIKGTILGIMNKRYIQHLTAQDVGQGHVSITSFGERQALRDSCALTDKANQNHTKEGADGELVLDSSKGNGRGIHDLWRRASPSAECNTPGRRRLQRCGSYRGEWMVRTISHALFLLSSPLRHSPYQGHYRW